MPLAEEYLELAIRYEARANELLKGGDIAACRSFLEKSRSYLDDAIAAEERGDSVADLLSDAAEKCYKKAEEALG